MKSTHKVRKQFLLEPSKIKRAQKILGTRTETETIDRALNDILFAKEIAKRFLKMAGRFRIRDMDQSSFVK